MGNYGSKLFSRHVDTDYGTDRLKPQNHMVDEFLTPKTSQKILPIDPRSATSGIPRTPIEVNYTPPELIKRTSAVPNYLQTEKPYIETDIDAVIPPLTPKRSPNKLSHFSFPKALITMLDISNTTKIQPRQLKKIMKTVDVERYEILGIDPRSPAADFDRTPILRARSMERIKTHSSENLFKYGSYNSESISSYRYSYCEISTTCNIPEIQTVQKLSSPEIHSTASSDTSNFVFDESNLSQLDNKIELNYSSDSCNHSKESIDEERSEITVLNANMESKLQKLSDTKFVNLEVNNLFDKENKLLENDEKMRREKLLSSNKQNNIVNQQSAHQFYSPTKNNDKIKIWTDSNLTIGFKELEPNKLDVNEKHSEALKEEIIITFDDDVSIKNSCGAKTAKSKTNIEKRPEFVKNKISKLDQKNNIDEKKNFSPDNKKFEISKCRTPLANRSNNGQMPTKSPQHLLRNKVMSVKLHQENTPPRNSTVKSKLNGTLWDPDSTIVI
ncbi:uncharacterized protein [Prorops nasuta]|uniref:uncharacterized protein n=1 Tax=Prorops nasuta TaxID=863751 RepID=UPI0034CE8C59